MEKLKVASLFCGCGGTDVGILGDFDYLFRLPKAINDYVDEMIAKDKDLTEVRTDFIRKVDKWFKANKFAEKYKAMK